MIRVTDLQKRYGRVHAVKGVSFEVNRGEIVGLLGHNGAGKSTTLKTISGLIQPLRGQILFQGQSIHKKEPHQIVRMGICQVPEGRDIFMGLTVQENLKMGAFTRSDLKAIQNDMERIFQSFPILKERARQQAGTLSGGEQQRVAIARALVMNPGLLLADEPTGNLDPNTADGVFELLLELNRETGSTLVVVTHSMELASRFPRILRVVDGTLIEERPAA